MCFLTKKHDSIFEYTHQKPIQDFVKGHIKGAMCNKVSIYKQKCNMTSITMFSVVYKELT